jgi:hypothetical protein
MEGFLFVQIMDPDEGGPKNNQNTYTVNLYILFYFLTKHFFGVVDDSGLSAIGSVHYDDSVRSPLAD